MNKVTNKMKISYETIEFISIFVWLGPFLASCYFAIKIEVLGFLPPIALIGGFFSFAAFWRVHSRKRI